MITSLVWLAIFLSLFVPAHPPPQSASVVEIADVQVAHSLSAIVTDTNKHPIDGVLVDEMSSDWKTLLRGTKTDSKGRFRFAAVKGRDVYYLELTCEGFNPLRVRFRVDPKRSKDLTLQMTSGTLAGR